MTEQLPAITGTSPKQVTYAEDMRTRTLAELDRIAIGKRPSILVFDTESTKVRPSRDADVRAAELDIVRAAVLRVTDACTWIDRHGDLISLTVIEWQSYWAGEMEHYWLTREEVAQIIALRTGQAAPVPAPATETAPEKPRTATTAEMAAALGVSLSTIYRRIKAGILAAVKVGRRWQITVPAAA